MIFSDIKQIEKDSKIKSLAGSGAYAIAVFMFLFLTKCDIANHLDEQEQLELGGGGVTVALGWPDQGFLNKDSDRGDNGGVKDPSPTPPTPSPTPTPSTPSPSPAPVVTSEAESDYVVQKKKELQDKKRKEQDEMDELIKKNRQEMENQQAEAKQKQREIDAEIKRKTDEKAKYDNAKASAGGLFNNKKPGTQTGGGGPGGGNGNSSGQGGAADGDPNSKNPNGNGGSGGGSGGGNGTGIGPSIGGGLGGRKIESRPPKLTDNSQNTGIVVLNVCVDEEGEVTTVNQKLQGSTTTNGELVRKAKENAKRYKFGKGSSGDCGTVTYNFKF